MTTLITGAAAMAGAIGVGWLSLASAGVPEPFESVPAGVKDGGRSAGAGTTRPGA